MYMGKHLLFILVFADIQKIHAESGTTTKQLIREVERMTERLVTNKGQCVACIGCIEESNCKTECGAIDDCLEKLAEYETAEEEGRLVVLPCKVGETVYAILHRRTPCIARGREFEEYSCSGCEEEKCDSHLEYFVWENKFATLEWIVGNLRKFGKTVFLTCEEAEKALEEMKRAME